MPIPDRLLALAPTDLPNQRPSRFDGGGFGLDLSLFGPADRARLARVYAAVNDAGQPGASPAEARARLLALDAGALVRDAAALGSDTPAAVTREPRVRQLLHDVRGGGVQVLVGTAELLRIVPGAGDMARNAVAAARDHAKIMRAGFPELDPEVYARDEAARVHVVDGFAATWDGLTTQQNGRMVTVSVDCEYRGPITGRCLETASIDRIMYNFLNNAMRFTADGRVSIFVFPVGAGLVRWVVHNALSEADRGWLDRATGGDLRALFRGGTTSGGNGVGLTGCTEIVSACFGVDPERALRSGHLGARADAGGDDAWFHWPRYAGSEAECECA